jgi:hypothetical protein
MWAKHWVDGEIDVVETFLLPLMPGQEEWNMIYVNVLLKHPMMLCCCRIRCCKEHRHLQQR